MCQSRVPWCKTKFEKHWSGAWLVGATAGADLAGAVVAYSKDTFDSGSGAGAGVCSRAPEEGPSMELQRTNPLTLPQAHKTNTNFVKKPKPKASSVTTCSPVVAFLCDSLLREVGLISSAVLLLVSPQEEV